MQVRFSCECGQEMQAEVGPEGGTAQCPACGKLLSLAGPAAAPYGQGGYVAPPRPGASGLAVAALVLGICGVIPLAGMLAAPVGALLAILVLLRRRAGRGLAIAGLVTAIFGAALQALIGLWVYSVYVSVQQAVGTIRGSTVYRAVPNPALEVDNLDDEQILAEFRRLPVIPAGTGPNGAAVLLAEARRLFDARDAEPGNRYRCCRTYAMYLALRGGEGFADPADGRRRDAAAEDLLRALREKCDSGKAHFSARRYAEAQAAFEAMMDLVPDEVSRIHAAAKEAADICVSLRGISPAGEP